MEVIGKKCVNQREMTKWITFEAGSQLSRLETHAFHWSGRASIHRPASVSVIADGVFVLGCPVIL
jgi:hypothetical protein